MSQRALQTLPSDPAEPAVSRETKPDRIVRLTTDLFLERGYDAVSINDIIQVVGGSKGTIYSNFGSKEKLFEAVVGQLCRDVTIRIDVSRHGTLEEQLARLCRSFLGIVLTPRILRFHRLMTSIGRSFPEAGQLFYDTGPRTAQGVIASWINHHQTTGALRADMDPFQLAVMLHDMLISDSILQWQTSATGDDGHERRVEPIVAMAVQVFLRGCAAPAD